MLMADHNPYSAPKSDTIPALTTGRFRWRIIPVGVLGAFGLIFVCGGLFVGFNLGYAIVAGHPLYTPGPDTSFKSLAGTVWCTGIGLSLVLSAWQWMKGRWWHIDS